MPTLSSLENICYFESDQKSSSADKLALAFQVYFHCHPPEVAAKDENIAIIQFANTMLPEEIITKITGLRQIYKGHPVIIIGPGLTFEQRFKLFMAGATEYLNYYTDEKYIITKIKEAIYHKKAEQNPAIRQKQSLRELMQLEYADLNLNLLTQEVQRNGIRIRLRRKEFDLLRFFMEQPERTFTTAELLDQVWGYSYETITNTVQAHISSLRKKLSVNMSKSLLHTFPKQGYILSESLAYSG